MILGITGPRGGPTAPQIKRLHEMLAEATALHHGACIGVDAVAHGMALKAGLQIVVHPPEDLKYADLSTMIELPNVIVLPRKPYLDRNRDIVDACDVMGGLPDGPERLRGSGTWHALRYARDVRKPRRIYGPDGEEMKMKEADEAS